MCIYKLLLVLDNDSTNIYITQCDRFKNNKLTIHYIQYNNLQTMQFIV